MSLYSVEQVLEYSSPFVVERFAEDHGVDRQSAEALFKETLKLLWLMDTQRREKQAGLAAPDKIIVFKQMTAMDEMWHAFLLFSREYTQFCQKYFGGYLHHVPTTSLDRRKEREAFEADPELHRKASREAVERQCRYIVDKLGLETLTLWYKQLPAQYARFQESHASHDAASPA